MPTIFLFVDCRLSNEIQPMLERECQNKTIPSICKHISNQFAMVNRREKDDVVREPVAIYPSLCTTAQGIYYSRPIPRSIATCSVCTRGQGFLLKLCWPTALACSPLLVLLLAQYVQWKSKLTCTLQLHNSLFYQEFVQKLRCNIFIPMHSQNTSKI